MKIDINALESAIADAIKHPSELLGVCLTVKEAQVVLALLKEQEAKETLSDAVHETAKQFRQTIVRCKDCKRRETYDCPVHVGYGGDGYDEPDDWFCADGEPKDS